MKCLMLASVHWLVARKSSITRDLGTPAMHWMRGGNQAGAVFSSSAVDQGGQVLGTGEQGEDLFDLRLALEDDLMVVTHHVIFVIKVGSILLMNAMNCEGPTSAAWKVMGMLVHADAVTVGQAGRLRCSLLGGPQVYDQLQPQAEHFSPSCRVRRESSSER